MTVLVKFEEMTVATQSLGRLLNRFDTLTANYVFNITSDFFNQAFVLFEEINTQCEVVFNLLSEETIFAFKKDFLPLFQILKQQVSLMEIMLKQLEQVENVSSLKAKYFLIVSRIEAMECVSLYPKEYFTKNNNA